jgi:magnesium chelatase family protein
VSLAKTYSAQLNGLTAEIVTIEVDISHGLHAFAVVGLGDRSVEESRDRISAAIKNSGFISPKQKNQKVVISLAPADMRKEGPSFDLAMALAYLSATGDISFDPQSTLFFGELSLEGRIRRVGGLLPLLCQAVRHGFDSAFVPADNAREASLASGLAIYAVSSLTEVIEHLSGVRRMHAIPPYRRDRDGAQIGGRNDQAAWQDIGAIRGNETAKRGLEIAAAGGHNILLYGPPGTGKTMLAQSLVSLLPPLSLEAAIEVTSIHSAARVLQEGLLDQPPFRSPHHTASYPSVVGGGAVPRPGEITLAHHGVLFLDEFPEFSREVIEALRQPLEDRSIAISRARGSVIFPARCILIASMNPCPCGKGIERGCRCRPHEIDRYRKKVSGPIMDRIDLWVNVSKIDYEKLGAQASESESSETVRSRVIATRACQQERFLRDSLPCSLNSEMKAEHIAQTVHLEDAARSFLSLSAKKLELSGRAFHRVIKVAQTIADLDAAPVVRQDHVLEALQYRQSW